MLAAWLVMRRMDAQAAKVSKLQSSLEQIEESEDAQRRFAEALTNTLRHRDALF